MRKNSWLQKGLYVVMAVLGAYILFKGGGLLAAQNQSRKAQKSGSVQQSLEDSAMRTWALGYTATVEGKKSSGWLSWWMSQVVPTFSYRVDSGEASETDSGEVSEADSGEESEADSGEASEADGGETSEADSGEVSEADGGETSEADSGEESEADSEEVSEADGGETSEKDDGEGSGADDGKVGEKDGVGDVDMPNETVVSETESPGMESLETGSMETENPGTESLETESSGTESLETGSTETENPEAAVEVAVRSIFSQVLPQLSDFSYLVSNYYTIDADTMADATLLNAEELLAVDLTLEQDASVPQILIYHTHAQEAFADSTEGEVRDTVVGMGEILAEELRGYGYNVIHDTGVYDLVDGVLDRSAAYDYARASIEAILEEYPTIEVVIDLHRDGVEGSEEDFVTEIDGEATSRIMFFNGLSRDAEGNSISWLPNSYLKENLAFSLQLQVLANAEYPGFTRKIYLQAERYNLHLRARSLLIEAGTQLNTVEEERNAMAPIARLIWQILS